MATPSPVIMALLATFRTAFTGPTFQNAPVVLCGLILTPGPRTVTATLRVLGVTTGQGFGKFHRVLNRAPWWPMLLGRLLLAVLIRLFLPADAPSGSRLVVLTVGWYGGTDKAIHFQTGRALWYTPGQRPVPIRWVLLSCPDDPHFQTMALLCSDTTAEPPAIVAWFVSRWNIEVTFEEIRAHPGFGTQRLHQETSPVRDVEDPKRSSKALIRRPVRSTNS